MSEKSSRQELERMLEVMGDLPPMPAVATKILKVAGSEDANVADVTRLIATDQGLASKVLGTCNSAYYGLPQRVKTLSRAVALLGFKSVRNLVLVHSLPWKRAGKPSFTDQAIFTHAAAVAMGGRVLAAQTGRCEPEEALLGGLMHDSGRLALNLLLPEEYEPVMRAIFEREGPSVELEQRALGFDHTHAGELVLRKWSFPDDLISIARDHHKAPEEMGALSLVVAGANEMANLMGYGVKPLEEALTEVPPALETLGYCFDDLDDLEERMAKAIEAGQDVFSL